MIIPAAEKVTLHDARLLTNKRQAHDSEHDSVVEDVLFVDAVEITQHNPDQEGDSRERPQRENLAKPQQQLAEAKIDISA